MTPHVNPRGHVALLVGDVLYLPDGRPVPFDEVTGWEEADDATPTPACLAAAQAAQAVIDARPAPKVVPRTLPVLEAPRAWSEAPEVARFRARVADLVRASERVLIEGEARANILGWLARLDAAAQRGGVSGKMAEAVEDYERCFDPAMRAAIAAQAESVLAWCGDATEGEAGFFARVAAARLRDARGGFVGSGKAKQWAQLWSRWKRLSDAVDAVGRP